MDIAGWEQRYGSGECGTESHPTALLVETAGNLAPGVAVDLACGAGRNALYLAKHGWKVTAIDGSERAIEIVRRRAAEQCLDICTEIADLTAADFSLAENAFNLAVIVYYLQRDLFPKLMAAVRPGGLVLAIAHTPEPGEEWSYKRARAGELRGFFNGWEILWGYEGPSRDPAHRRPVAEIVARRPGGSSV